MNAIDRLVGWLNPGAGLRRVVLRQALTRAYEAAAPKDTWRPRRSGASADADHRADAAVLRAKARSLYQNVPYIRAGIEGLVSYTIGTGITSRAIGREAEAFNAAFAAWQSVCDSDGRLSWSGMQAAAQRAMEIDGEVLIRIRPRRPTDGLPIPLQLQLMEIDYLDTSKTGMVGNNEIVNGIEYDMLGRAVGYWLWDRHPGSVVIPRGSMRESFRVAAQNIIHLYSPERPGQGRGFTRLAPVIARVRDLQLYEDAELARKNLETRLSVLASGNVSELSEPEPGSGPLQPGDLGDLGGGTIIQIPPGMNTTVIEPKAAPGYVENVVHHLHVIASGIGVPYELLTGDVSQTNFSSARVRRLDFRTAVQAAQWNVIIPRLIEPVCRAAAQAAALAGVTRAPIAQWDHSTPKWDYVNPEQDVRSDMLEISAGLSSISEKLRQRGYNPAAVIAEIKADFEALGEAGVMATLLALQGKVMPGVQEASATAAARAAIEAAREGRSVINVGSPIVQPSTAEVRVEGATVLVDAPVVHNHQASPEVRVEVAAPSVHVDAPTINVQPSAAEVRVEASAPVVNVAAPVIPAPVVNVTTPRRRTDSTVAERDSMGRIVRTTQIEMDLPD